MFANKNRLKKEKEFKDVFQKGKGFKNNFLFLKIKKNNLEYNRLGIVVSKKISNKAVVRNQVKRRLREIIKKESEIIKPGWDIVLVAQPGIEKQKFTSLKEEVDKLIKDAFKNN